MSDLFTRLSLQARGAEQPVRPLTTPLFAVPDLTPTLAEETREETVRPAKRQGSIEEHAVGVAAATREKEATPLAPAHEKVLEQPGVPGAPEMQATPGGGFAPASPALPAPVAERPSVRPPEQSPAQFFTARGTPAGAAPPPDETAPPTRRMHPETAAPTAPFEPAERRHVEPAPEPHATVVRERLLESRVEVVGRPATELRFPEQPYAPVAPSITRITIGRVEVRATLSPPASPPKRAAPAPAMSLSDYLEKRNGGKI